MKFVRRPDLTARTRLWMALTMSLRGVWGQVSALSREYRVSRKFLYDNERRLLRLFEVERSPQDGPLDKFLLRLMLCLRLHCHSPIEGIVRTFQELGWRPGSAGHVSECLRGVAETCRLDVPRQEAPVVLLLDEIFTHDRPILVVMEAASHYILNILLMSDRQAGTWEAVLRELQAAGLDIGLLVKDQGGSLKAAAKQLGLPERADLFHLLKPFDPFLPSLERHAYGAIAHQFERARVFENRKTEESLAEALARYEAACEEEKKAIRNSDAYTYLHQCLHESFDSFTSLGQLRPKTVAQGDIAAALSLFSEQFPSHAGILAAVQFLRHNLDDYWNYFEQLEDIVHRHARTIPEYTLRAVCLAWQCDKKAMAVKNPQVKKELACQSKELLAFALNGTGAPLKAEVDALFADLDANVRSSAPLEAINSVIRAILNSCRGQVTQTSLNMLAFFLNHRRATRGKYAGTSPNERLTGQREQGSPIEQLVRLSFQDHKMAQPEAMRTSAPPTQRAA